jgi:RNA methyltransferase, TrmH family
MGKMEAISKNHLKELAKLTSKKFRQASSTVIVEGMRTIQHLADNNIKFLELYLNEENHDLKLESGITYLLKPDQFRRITTTKNPQKIAALVQQKTPALSDQGFVLYLDNIKEPGNLGTIIRTAEAAGASGLVLSPDSCSIYNPKTIRASMGSVFTFPIEYHDYEWLRTANARKISTVVAKGEDLFQFPKPEGNIILIIGSEADGISRQVMELTTDSVMIPLANNIESLNAAIAAGIAIYHFLH